MVANPKINIKELIQRAAVLPQLKVLNLSYNQIQNLPVEIEQLVNLEKLILNNNRIQSLPKQVFTLKNLKNLSIAENKLTSLPDNIGELTSLEELDLSSNQTLSLQQAFPIIGKSKSLKKLYLFGIYNFPKEIESLRTLRELYVSDDINIQQRSFLDQTLLGTDVKY